MTVTSTPARAVLRRALDLIVGWQLRHPGRVLGVIAALTVLSIGLATRLRVETSFESLLPQSRPSVVELRRVSARTASQSTIFVVLEGQDPAGLRRAVDALVPALRALGPPWVGSVESGVHDALAFLRPRTGLYTDLATLKKLRDDVEARYAYEVGKETGLQLGLEDAPPPPIAPDTVKSRLGVKAEDERRFPGDGRYQNADGKKAVVLIRSGVVGADFQKAEEAVARVSEVVKRVNPASFDPAAKWDLSGDLLIGLAEYRLINRDLTEVGLAGTVLILGIVFLYYLRIRTVVSMGLGIGVGVAWTFALTELLIGRLNLATGFLFTIIAGNGINFSILLMARYLEERRHGRPTEAAILEAMRCTWRPTLTAAATASAAYGALVVTEFKGFREFGWIGGMGMLVCWAAAFLALPPMLLLMERWAPLERVSWWRRALRVNGEGVPFGEPFARLVASAPRTITVVGTALAIVGAVLTVVYVRSDPMEYDTNRIQSDRHAVAEVHRLFHVASELTGFVGVDGMAVMTDRLDQVAPLKAALEARRDAAPADAKPFKGVHALQDLVPGHQEEKNPHPHAAPATDFEGAPDGPGARLGKGGAVPPARGPPALRHRRAPRRHRASLHREGRDARAHRLHQPRRRERHRRRALPPALGGRLPRDGAPRRDGDPRLGPGGHLRRHVERHPQGRPASGARSRCSRTLCIVAIGFRAATGDDAGSSSP